MVSSVYPVCLSMFLAILVEVKSTTGEIILSSTIAKLVPNTELVKSTIDHYRDHEKVTHYTVHLKDGRILTTYAKTGARLAEYLENQSDHQQT